MSKILNFFFVYAYLMDLQRYSIIHGYRVEMGEYKTCNLFQFTRFVLIFSTTKMSEKRVNWDMIVLAIFTKAISDNQCSERAYTNA